MANTFLNPFDDNPGSMAARVHWVPNPNCHETAGCHDPEATSDGRWLARAKKIFSSLTRHETGQVIYAS